MKSDLFTKTFESVPNQNALSVIYQYSLYSSLGNRENLFCGQKIWEEKHKSSNTIFQAPVPALQPAGGLEPVGHTQDDAEIDSPHPSL